MQVCCAAALAAARRADAREQAHTEQPQSIEAPSLQHQILKDPEAPQA
jgi:hypothetical protein